MARPLVPSRSTDAYVLRTSNYGEADRIVVLVSPEVGKLEGIARSARRLRGRFGSGLEPLSWGRVQYRERPGRDLATIEKFTLERSAFRLLSDPDRLVALSHLAELAQAVAVPGQEHDKLIRLLHACLDAARIDSEQAERAEAELSHRLALLRLYFDLWVARIEGFWPDLGDCADCGRDLDGSRRVGLYTQGALCSACRRNHQEPSLPLSAVGAQLAAQAIRQSPHAFLDIVVEPRVMRELAAIAAALLTVHLDRELRTMPAPSVVRRRPGER